MVYLHYTYNFWNTHAGPPRMGPGYDVFSIGLNGHCIGWWTTDPWYEEEL